MQRHHRHWWVERTARDGGVCILYPVDDELRLRNAPSRAVTASRRPWPTRSARTRDDDPEPLCGALLFFHATYPCQYSSGNLHRARATRRLGGDVPQHQTAARPLFRTSDALARHWRPQLGSHLRAAEKRRLVVLTEDLYAPRSRSSQPHRTHCRLTQAPPTRKDPLPAAMARPSTADQHQRVRPPWKAHRPRVLPVSAPVDARCCPGREVRGRDGDRFQQCQRCVAGTHGQCGRGGGGRQSTRKHPPRTGGRGCGRATTSPPLQPAVAEACEQTTFGQLEAHRQRCSLGKRVWQNAQR